jgi:hypothetical protein
MAEVHGNRRSPDDTEGAREAPPSGPLGEAGEPSRTFADTTCSNVATSYHGWDLARALAKAVVAGDAEVALELAQALLQGAGIGGCP